MLVNLIFNALDIMPSGGVLGWARLQDDDGAVRLTVEDTGPGIDAKVADRLFTPVLQHQANRNRVGAERLASDRSGPRRHADRSQPQRRWSLLHNHTSRRAEKSQ